MVYGEDLDRLGEDAVPEAWRRYGLFGLVRLLADIAVRLPGEYLGEIRHDVVYAVRVLARSPGFAAVAILSLALGIAMCSVILCGSSSVLRPHARRARSGARWSPREEASPIRTSSTTVTSNQVAGAATVFLASVPFAVASTGDKNARAERFYGHLVSPEYFSTLGVTPAAGRFFAPETEKPGMAPVVVVTDRFWRTHLNSDPHAVGRAMRLNGQLATIVGIAPEDFLGMWPFNPADLVCAADVRLCPRARARRRPPARAAIVEMFRMVLRLPHGVSLAGGRSRARCDDPRTRPAGARRGPRSRSQGPAAAPHAGRHLRATPHPSSARSSTASICVMWVLILSLVCANLANLLLARGGRRRREIALRLSVGASRARLVRQFLTESVLLSLAGGAAGIGLAYWICRMHVRSAVAIDGAVERRLSPRFPHFRAHPGGFVGDRDCLRPRARAGRRARRYRSRGERRRSGRAARLPALQPAQPLCGRPGGRRPHAAAGHRVHRHRLREHQPDRPRLRHRQSGPSSRSTRYATAIPRGKPQRSLPAAGATVARQRSALRGPGGRRAVWQPAGPPAPHPRLGPVR